MIHYRGVNHMKVTDWRLNLNINSRQLLCPVLE